MDTLTLFPAQKLNIKSMRGCHFKLVVNVKNSDGGNYDFTDIADNSGDTTESSHQLNLRIYFNSPEFGVTQLVNDPFGVGDVTTAPSIQDSMSYTVEDGKLTVEWDIGAPYAPPVGRYKYHLYTISNLENSPETIWLYGDFIVIDNNPLIADVDVWA